MTAALVATTYLLVHRLGFGGEGLKADPRQIALFDVDYSAWLASKAGAEGLVVFPYQPSLDAVETLLKSAQRQGLKIFVSCDLFGIGKEERSEDLACQDERGGAVYWCLSEPKVIEAGDKALRSLLKRLGRFPAFGGIYFPAIRFRGGYCPRCKASRASLPDWLSMSEFQQRLLTSLLKWRRRLLKEACPEAAMLVQADIGKDTSMLSLPNAVTVADVLVVSEGGGRTLPDIGFDFDLLRGASEVTGRLPLGAISLDVPHPTRALGLALLRATGVLADGLQSLLQPIERGFELSYAFKGAKEAFKEAEQLEKSEPLYEVAVVTSVADLRGGGGGRERALYRALLESGFPPSAEYARYLPERAKRFKAFVVACESLPDGAAWAIAQAVRQGAVAFLFGSCGTRDEFGRDRGTWAFSGLLPIQRAGWVVVRRVALRPTEEGRRLGLLPMKLDELLPRPPRKGNGGEPPGPIRLEEFRLLPGAGEAVALATAVGGAVAVRTVEVGKGKVVLIGLYGPICPSELPRWSRFLSTLFRALLPSPRLEVKEPFFLLDVALRPLSKEKFSLQTLSFEAAPVPKAEISLPFRAKVVNVKGAKAQCQGNTLLLENLDIYAKIVLSRI